MIEKKIKQMIIARLDGLYAELTDSNFSQLSDDFEELDEEECLEAESCLMSFRNVIANTEWDGDIREYEKYEVR